MSREEIREGLYLLRFDGRYGKIYKLGYPDVDKILTYLHSQGAVLKVDTDLQVLFTDEDKNIISQTKSEWAVVVPLIGGE